MATSRLFGVLSVCRTCFRENSADQRGLDCHRHRDAGVVEVVWDVDYRCFIPYKIRPLPGKEITGSFIRCRFMDRCSKGERCTYAHSEAEQREWNRLKDSGSTRPTFGRVNSIPMKKKSNAAAPMQKRHVSHQVSLPTLPLESVQPPVKSQAMDTGSVHVNSLSRENYKSRFNELIESERISHSDILQKRCDGSYIFVVEMESRSSEWWMYLVGISGDNIAYVTQASDSFSMISRDGHKIKGLISGENFYHTEEILYVDVKKEDILQSYNIKSRSSKYEWPVNVTFDLKDHYFYSLQRFVGSLSSTIINCLLPSDFPPFQPDSLEKCYATLNLEQCSDDQRNALAAIIAIPIGSPPILVTGPFGTGKTRILALVAHYFLQNNTSATSILVCTQQHVSAEAFLDCVMNLLISTPDASYVARITNRKKSMEQWQKGKGGVQRHVRTCDEFASDFKHRPPTNQRPFLIVTTCQTAHKLKGKLPRGCFFSHILIDEVAQMREAEAVAPLCLASGSTKIILAGDKQQVGPDLLVLGEQTRQKGFSKSLLERLEMAYTRVGRRAASYVTRLVTNYRCHSDILSLSEKLFYKSPLKSVVSAESTHPDALYPLVFVCSDLTKPMPSENPSNELEARIIIEQLQKFAPGWPQDRWGAKVDPSQICLMSSSRTQVNKIKEMIFKKETKVPDILKQVERHPSYDMQGREYRVLFLSTYEATHEDGSTRNPTKSIADPYVVNTVITRARSLVVSVGNPYLLLNMEKHICKKYGEKGKYWSNYIKRCLDHNSVVFHSCTGVYDADKQSQIDRLSREVEKLILAKYELDESTATDSSDVTPIRNDDMEQAECEIPKTYTGRLEIDFSIGECLGKGGFAHVYKVTSKTDGGSYALKIVQLPSKQNSFKKVLREVRGLRKLDQPHSHANIVRYFGSWVDVCPTDDRRMFAPWNDMEGGKAIPLDDSDSGTSVHSKTTETETFTSANYSSDSAAVTKYTGGGSETDSTTIDTLQGVDHGAGAPLQNIPYLLIRTELCGKTLKQWLESHERRKRQLLLRFFEQILDAVRYIHSKKLAHRDLKPSNIFQSLRDRHVLKVGDFGLVAGSFGSPDISSRSESRHQVSFSGQAGTPLYMSPEQLERTRCTEKVDIYALGVIYFEMNCVFATNHEKAKVLKVFQKEFAVPDILFAKRLPAETTVIQKMMTHDPDRRPTAEHILESRWFDNLKENVQKEGGYISKM